MDRIPRRMLIAGATLCVAAFVASLVMVNVDRGTDVDGLATSTAEASSPVTPSPTAAPMSPVARVFPVIPLPGHSVSYGHSHHGYPATDVLTESGASYVAPIDGVVTEVDRVDDWNRRSNLGPTRGGLSVAILGVDKVRYYGSHFQSINDDVEPGLRVKAGDPIAVVGRSGDAGACHVHFGLSPVCLKNDWYIRRGVIWPWPYLDSWRSGGNDAPGTEIQQWLAGSGCPTSPSVEP